MKTTFKQYLLEAEEKMPPAEDGEDLLDSIVDGHFTKDGSKLKVFFGGDFDCSNKKLESLKGCPQTLRESFSCSFNLLESLEGCPQKVGWNFDCWNNHLTSLESIHMHVHEIKGHAYFEDNPIKSHVLGLLKIKGLKSVKLDNGKVAYIINKYLHQGGKDPSLRDIVDCQEELMDNDLEDYALL